MPISPVYPPPSGEIEILPSFPYRTGETRFRFLPDIQRETVEQIVLGLPRGQQLSFYNALYPSPSDPGAYFSLARGVGGFILFCGNHGWSSDWRGFETGVVIRYLWGCRSFNSDETNCLQLSADNHPNRPVSREKNSYFARNVADRLKSMVI